MLRTLHRPSLAPWASRCRRVLTGTLLLVIAGQSGVPASDDAESPKPVANLGHADAVYALGFSPDGSRISVGSGTYGRGAGFLTTWDVASREELEHISLHRNAISCLEYSPDGKYLATASIAEFLRPARLTVHTLDQGERAEIVVDSHEVFAFWDLRFSRDGKILIAAHDEGKFTFWDVTTGELKHTIDEVESRGVAIAVSPVSDEVACVDLSGTVQRIDMTTFELIETFRIGTYADAATYSAEGSQLLVAGGDFDSEASEWTRTGVANRHISNQSTTFLETHQLPKAMVVANDTSLFVSTQDPASKLESGGQTSLLRLTLSPFEIADEYTMNGRINCIAVAPDGQTILTGTESRMVQFWDSGDLGIQ